MTQASPAPSSHLAWIDVAKGLGILLVVMGHVVSSPAGAFIYLFHMPLFFILSGYLYRQRGNREFILSKAKSLLVPYGVFLGMLFVLVHFPSLLHGGVHGQSVINALYGGKRLTAEMGVFWFVTCLFGAQVFYNFLANTSRTATSLAWRVAGIGLLGIFLAAWLPKLSLPWSLDLVPVALAFYGVGHWLRVADVPKAWLIGLCVVILGSCGVCWLAGVSFSFDMKYSNLGPPLLGVVLAASLAWLIMELCQKLAQIRPLERCLSELGRASLVIMFLHQAVNFTLRSEYGQLNDWLILLAGIGLPYIIYRLAERSEISRRLLLGKA